jgi:L-alanine-DL-glutamate epimerase-like enolase superfamily enzyme
VIKRWEVLAYSARIPPGRGYLLRLHDDSGRVGLGEARALEGFGSGPAALEAFISRPETVQSLLDRLAAEPMRAPEWATTAPVEALFAAETALSDLAAQDQGMSLVQQLGFALPEALCNSLLVSDEADALRLLREGHRNFKLKAQGVASEAMALLCCLFDAGEGTTRIRVDANGSWDRDTARAFLQQAPQGSISFVEQPFPPGDLDSCLWLRDRVTIPIALDEGAVSAEAVSEAARRGAAQLLVIKPMYHGLQGALRLAAAAAEHSLGVCVTHAMDSTVGRLATMHVAAAVGAMCPDATWPHGLYAPGLTCLADEPALQPDCLLMPTGHGLGCRGLRLNELEPVCEGP